MSLKSKIHIGFFLHEVRHNSAARIFFVFMLFFPVYFQLGFNLYSDPTTLLTNSGGITRLPIPFSLPACFLGLLFGGGTHKALPSWLLVGLTCVLMIATTLIASWPVIDADKWKLLLFQYLLPMFAFIYGYSLEPSRHESGTTEKGILMAVGLIVPLQLVSTWMHRASFHGFGHMEKLSAALHDEVFFFSIYQHLQYVPCILIGAFFFALFSLWGHGKTRFVLIFLTPFVGVYAVASTSKLAVGGFLLGLIGFFIDCAKANRLLLPSLLLIVSLVLPTGYFLLGTKTDKGDNILNAKFSFLVGKNKRTVPIKDKPTQAIVAREIAPSGTTSAGQFQATPTPVSGRLGYWQFYVSCITESAHAFFFGHSEQPNMKIIPSAHNYYLDFVYNFGFLAFFPILLATVITIGMIISAYVTIITSPRLLGLTFSVVFLLFADNLFKVGMRQLYPGIATFFLWGLLVNHLLSARQIVKNRTSGDHPNPS